VGVALTYAERRTDGRKDKAKPIGAFRYLCECA